jgi:O-antigen ligase
MSTALQNDRGSSDSPALRLFALAFGLFLGLAFLKFPNPPVMEHFVTAPEGGLEWMFVSWPVRVAYPIAGALFLAGLALMRRPARRTGWMAWLPLVWLTWVGISALYSISPGLSRKTVVHFTECVASFYLGLLVISRVRRSGWFLAGLVGALLIVIGWGWDQHFGGLEASRQQFMMYQFPQMATPPPAEFMNRMNSTRIFSTLFYANSLAGALLLLTPVVLGMVADAKGRFTLGARWLLAGLVAVSACLCLAWSGSKAGWLLALGMGVAALVRAPIERRWKMIVLCVLVSAGAAGFLVRYFGFLKRGAPSVVQRFNYWQAAWQNLQAHPCFGSGPGTFAIVYEKVKPPEAEMARLVHNDYLQQGSDSGWVAGILFLALVIGVLLAGRWVWAAKINSGNVTGSQRVEGGPGPEKCNWTLFGVWLGLAGLATQSFMEFGFYVPATAWCWFALAGWLMGARLGVRQLSGSE